jgi:FixJ family two-component response regulator
VASEQTIFIVEHDTAARELVAALAAYVRVKSQEYESGEDFLASYDRARGGCLVAAIQLPGMSGLELMDVMNRDGIRLPTIIVSAFADVRLVVRAMHAGAVTLLEKPYRNQELWEAIREALALDGRRRHKEARLVQMRRQLASLTRDEQRVLECILAGKTNTSQELSVGLRTVQTRRHALMVKLQVDSLAALIQTVIEARLTLSVRDNERAAPCSSAICAPSVRLTPISTR